MQEIRWLYIGIFAIYVLGLAFITWLARREAANALAQGSTFLKEYFVGGRTLGGVALMLHFMATAVGSGAYVGTPGLTYQMGMAGILPFLGVAVGFFYVPYLVIGKRVIDVAERTDAITMLDILRSRFNSKALIIFSAIAIFVLYLAYLLAIFAAGAWLLNSILGFPYAPSLLIFGVIIVLYTAIGGFRAVAWTDVLQGTVMCLGALFLIPISITAVGGLGGLTRTLMEIDLDLVMPPGPGNFVPMSMVVSWFAFWTVGMIGLPSQTTRFLGARNRATIKTGAWLGTVIVVVCVMQIQALGVPTRALFSNLAASDLAMPTLIINIMPPFIGAVVMTSVFAALMSTVDSFLLVMSGCLVKDIYHNYVNPNISQVRLDAMSKLVTLIAGLIAVVLSLNPPDLLQAYVFLAWGGLGATFTVPLVAALYWPRATTPGAIAATLGGFISYALITIYMEHPLDVHTIVWSLLISSMLLIGVSLATPQQSSGVLKTFFGRSISSLDVEATT